MQNRTIADYDEIFVFVKDKMLEIGNEAPQSPTTLLDFERASSVAFNNTFDQGEILRCFFHLSQSVYRKVQEFGLVQRYNDGTDLLRQKTRELTAVAFLPQDDIEAHVLSLYEDEEDQDFLRLLNYFNDTYVSGKIKRTTRNGNHIRSPPLYPMEDWNVYQRFQQDQERTTNCIESFHNHLKIVATHHHLQVRNLITILMEEDKRTSHRADQHLVTEMPQPKRSKKTNEKRDNMARIFIQFTEGNMAKADYLFAMAKNTIM